MKESRVKWLILTVCCIVVMVNAGVRLSFGIFIKPLENTFNISRSMSSLVQSFFELGFGIFQLTMGRVVDIRGPKKVILVGLIVLAASFSLLSKVKAVSLFYVIYGIIIAFGAGSTSLVTNIAVVKNRFKSEGALPVSAITASVSVGQLVLIPVVSYFVTNLDWRAGYLYLSLLTAVTALLVFVGMPKDKMSDSVTHFKQKMFSPIKFKEIIKSYSFWVFGLVFMVCGFGFSFVATHLIPYVLDIPLAPRQASNALALIGGVSIVGTLGTGYISRLFSKNKIILLLFLVRALAMGLLLFSESGGTIYIFAVIIGLTWTATVPLITDLSSEKFGVENTGTVLGALFLLHQFGAAAGSYMGGLISDYTHGYHLMFFISAVLDIGAALLIWLHRRRHSKITTKFKTGSHKI